MERYNILISRRFRVHMMCNHERNTHLCMPPGCEVHPSIFCFATQEGGVEMRTRMGQVLTFTHLGYGIQWTENMTPDTGLQNGDLKKDVCAPLFGKAEVETK